jgi:Mg2+ and Co2+ transporter CorA
MKVYGIHPMGEVLSPANPIKYLQVRIKMLRDERNKNDDETAHMILDKCIDELHVVYELLKRQVK